jgi:peptidoglycan/LPS O-acetylase OafA/YrhL
MQIAEGYAMHLQGIINCGTQAKLTTWLSNIFFMLTAYIFISKWNINIQNRIMDLLGKYSFGIYLLHILVIQILLSQPYIHFPYGILSIVVLLISLTLVILLSKICGKTVSKYMGLY